MSQAQPQLQSPQQPSPRQQAIIDARALARALVVAIDQIVALSRDVGLGDVKRIERARMAASDAMIAVMMLHD